jgi:hypothetical protein
MLIALPECMCYNNYKKNLAYLSQFSRILEVKQIDHTISLHSCFHWRVEKEMKRNKLASYHGSSPRKLRAFAVISLGVSICSASPLPHSLTALKPFRLFSRQTADTKCTFTGNSDLYGLGIRIGIYLQWTSGLLANTFHADSVQDMLATNTIFLMALFIALAIITANATVLAAEVMILLQFCFGFLFTVLFDLGMARLGTPAESSERVQKTS